MKRNCNRHMHEKLHKEYQLNNHIKTDDKLRHDKYPHDIKDDIVRYDGHIQYITDDRLRHEKHKQYIPDNKLRHNRYTHDIGCQIDSKCGDVICKYKNSSKRAQEVKHFGSPKQVYAYHKANFTDVGVSSVKTVQRKKVKRIYLQETENRGVGSSDLSSFISRKSRQARGSSYDHKTTSSKCVGSVRQSIVECVVDAKLSPLMRMNSVSTSPNTEDQEKKNIDISNSALTKKVVTATTQVDDEYIRLKTIKPTVSTQESPKQTTREISYSKLGEKNSRELRPRIIKNVIDAAEKVYSTESLLQHVHNLENLSENEQSFTLLDPMENKLEREYRRMFSTKSKDPTFISELPIPDLKSSSLLRWRFKALKRGLAQKENSKKNAVLIGDEINPMTIPSKKDVSIASDPPSLEARSYSFTKAYNSVYDQDETELNPKAVYNKSVANKKERAKTGEEADEEGVRGMFKLWGEKFDFEEQNYKNKSKLVNTKSPHKVQKEPETVVTVTAETERKKGKKFFFFGRKSKDKTKPYKPKKGVTTGRCEVKDGLMIKIGKTNSVYDTAAKKEPEKPNCDVLNEHETTLGKVWLKKFLEQTIESKNSVQIRWNNKTYATSSSTVFELMDHVYNQTEITLKSNSEMSTVDSLACHSFKKQKVSFLQDIETWMIPKLIPERPKQQPIKVIHNSVDEKNNIKIKNIDRKCYIDKSKAFANKIEVVLHSKNFINRRKKTSSEFLKIDIPKDFFSDSISLCDERGETSNSEEVYKIVEYVTPESNTRFRINKGLDTGAILTNNINEAIHLESKNLDTDIKEWTKHRDVIIQVSNVCIPRLCDVIGVGIITQRDIKEIRKPILKIQYDYSDDESDYEHVLKSNQKTCEFAESYLQDFYRHWIPLGMDVYSWCVGDSHLQSCSDSSQTGANNQDGTKSCPNICDNYQGSTIISSYTTSSCSHCNTFDDRQQQSLKLLSKFLSKCISKSEPNENTFLRVLPKDSFEVFKRRKLYACSNKSKWFCADDKPYSIPSKEDKCEDTLSNSKTTCCEPKPCKKHVSFPRRAEQLSEQVSGILVFKGAAGCDACKNQNYCAKHSQIKESPSCEIPQPPCKQSCEKNEKPECSKPNQSSCNVPKPPYNVPCMAPGKTSPCQKKSSPPPNILIPPSPKPSPPICPKPKICSSPIRTHSPPCLPLPNCPKPSSSPVCPKSSPTLTGLRSPSISPHTPPYQQTKTCVQSPPCSCLPRPVCPHLQKKKRQSCKDTPPTGSSCTTCSLKSLLPMMKSSCDCCIKKQLQGPMKDQVSNQSPGVQCNKNQQEKSLQTTPHRCSQMDRQTQESQISTKPKSGIYLKMDPSCPPPKKNLPSNNKCTTPSLSSLLSNENLRIKVNKMTPSTEEIREGLNIKVQDADGQTLYERRDYTTHRSSIIGEIYNVHQVSTPRVQSVQLNKINHEEKVKTKSEASIANQIEIHFKLKLIPGNKTTEMKIDSERENEPEKSEIKNDIRPTSQDVFVVKEIDESIAENSDDKNDINIKIVIKNYNTTSKKEQLTEGGSMKISDKFNSLSTEYNTKSKKEQLAEDYSKKISDKFHSVSTRYSAVDDQIFSLHETKIEVQSSEEIMVQEFADKATTSTTTIHDATMNKEPTVDDPNTRKNLINNEKESQIFNVRNLSKTSTKTQPKSEEIQEQKLETLVRAADDDERGNTLNIPSDEPSDFNNDRNIPRPPTRQEKAMLKMVFEKADDLKKEKRKNRMNILKAMLRTVLTSDSSDREEITAASTDLTKDIKYVSPNHNRNTDSMNNYDNNDNIVLKSDDECKVQSNFLAEEHSVGSITSDLSEPHHSHRNCICSTSATRLNLSKTIGGGCCCCSLPPLKVDEETYCDLRNEIDIFCQKHKAAQYCDVQIQSSIKSNKVKNRESIADVQSRKITKVMDDMSKESHLKGNEKKEVKNKVSKRTFSPHVGRVEESATRRDKNMKLCISEDDNIHVLNTSTRNKEKTIHRKETVLYTKTADILQSYETKKAVLAIYAKKTFRQDGEHLVAKLPKFVCDKESAIVRNYREIMAKCNSVSDINIVL